MWIGYDAWLIPVVRWIGPHRFLPDVDSHRDPDHPHNYSSSHDRRNYDHTSHYNAAGHNTASHNTTSHDAAGHDAAGHGDYI